MLDWVTKELARRARNLDFIRRNPKQLPALKKYYATHRGAFTNDWVFTYDPRVQPSKMPFNLWSRQLQFFNAIDEAINTKESLIVPKPRDKGITWCECSFAIEDFLFLPESRFIFNSYKAELVDLKGDIDSIFERMRFILDNLPQEFLPRGYNRDKHSPYFRLLNPENGSSIKGSTGPRSARGGRARACFADEYAFTDQDTEVDSALSAVSDTIIYSSTAHGMGNDFYRKVQNKEIKKFYFKWDDDPRMTEALLDKKRRSMDPMIFEQEVMCNFAAALNNTVIKGTWIEAAINLDLGEPSGKKIAGLDVANDGGDKNAFAPRQGYKVFDVEAWPEGNTSETANRALMLAKKYGVKIVNYDSIGVGAGVRGEASKFDSSIQFEGINVGWGLDKSNGYINDGDNFSSGNDFVPVLKMEIYANYKAMLWWEVRRRFEKTWEHVNGIRNYPIEELISIPDDPELKMELSTPTYSYTNNGKIIIESKKSLKIASPNKADAVMLSFAPIETSIGIHII